MKPGYLDDLAVFIRVGRAPNLEVASEMLKDDVTHEAIARLAKRIGYQVIRHSGLMTTAGAKLFRQTMPALSVLQNTFDASVKVDETPPMSAMEKSPDLHDAVLLRIDSHWESGDALVWIRRGPPAEVVIKGLGTSRIDWRRSHPWGASRYINEVRGPIHSETMSRLEIEMQSGDTLILEAREFEFGSWR